MVSGGITSATYGCPGSRVPPQISHSNGPPDVPNVRVFRDVLAEVVPTRFSGIELSNLIAAEFPSFADVESMDMSAAGSRPQESVSVRPSEPASLDSDKEARTVRKRLKPSSGENETTIGTRSGRSPAFIEGEGGELVPLEGVEPAGEGTSGRDCVLVVEHI